MEKKPEIKFFPTAALICAIWFLLTSWLWTYLANLILSYPVGLLGLFFWNKAHQVDKTNPLNKTAFVVLVMGLLSSIISLALLLIFN